MRARLFSLVLAIGCFAFSVAQPAFTLTVLHTNDVHAHVEPTTIKGKTYGGYARIATLVKRFKATDPNPIVLNAGDTFQGTLYYNSYRGLADAHLMNLVGYNAACLGNHEFDDGPTGLLPFLKAVRFPVLCANLDMSGEPFMKNYVRPSMIMNVGGQRVGIIGLITPDLPDISSPGPNLKLKDLDTCLRAEITKLTNQKVNKIMVLSHCGYAEDVALARRNPDVDIIVGGHSHTLLSDTGAFAVANPAGPYPTQVGNTIVVQAWEWAKVLGRIKVDFDAAGVVTGVRDAKPILVDDTIPDDPLVASAVSAFRKPILALANEVVGETKNGLPRDSGPEMRMGDVIADAMLAYTAKTGAKIAFMNRGGVRSAIEPGPITYGEIISVQPFGNTLVVLDVTGQDILDMLTVGATKAGTVQVSAGFSYRIGAGGAISAMTLNGAPLELGKTYRIVTNNFMARGGDGFTSLANAKGYRLDTGLLDSEALIEYLKVHKPMDVDLGGRIKTGG